LLTLPDKLTLEFYRANLEDRPCRRLDHLDSGNIQPLAEQMARLCRRAHGSGLAAPQVGIDVQLAILIPAPGKIELLVNPEIVNLGGRDLLESEGCLSLPPSDLATAPVWRSEIAHVRSGTVEDPEAGIVTVYKGYPARIAQHEIDHLHGIFFIDRCRFVSREIVLRRYRKFLHENGA